MPPLSRPMEQLVQFRNRSGKWLRGMIHRPAGRAAKGRGLAGVVFFHGFTGDRFESHWIFVKCARALARAGVAALRFDFYGTAESEGEFRQSTLQSEISDARVAVEFLGRQKGIDSKRLGLVGMSLGGAIAATVAAESRARALVLWSAVARPAVLRTLAETNSRPIAGAEGAREYSAHHVSARFLENLEKVNPLKSIARYKQPTLIIHPGKDELLPLSHAEDYFRAAGSAVKEKIIIPGADHCYTSIAWEGEVIRQTVGWLARHL